MILMSSIHLMLYIQLEKVYTNISKHYLEFLKTSSVNPFFRLLKHKPEFLINSSVWIPLVKLEFFRNSSTIFRSRHQRCFLQNLFFKILQYSQENSCGGVSCLIKLQTFKPTTLLKRDSKMWVFSNEICEIFNDSFFMEHLLWLCLSPKQIKRNKNIF